MSDAGHAEHGHEQVRGLERVGRGISCLPKSILASIQDIVVGTFETVVDTLGGIGSIFRRPVASPAPAQSAPVPVDHHHLPRHAANDNGAQDKKDHADAHGHDDHGKKDDHHKDEHAHAA